MGVFISAVLAAAFAGSAPDYAATPQGAAIHAYCGAGRPVAEHTNVAGRYATVVMRDGMAGLGCPAEATVLVEQFSFGWQAVDNVDGSCSLQRRALALRDQQVLLQGVPTALRHEPCTKVRISDAGSPADISAVRRLMVGPVVSTVDVVGNYALATFTSVGGEEGGEAFFAFADHAWHLVTHGGGALTAPNLVAYGVPRHDACILAGTWGAEQFCSVTAGAAAPK